MIERWMEKNFCFVHQLFRNQRFITYNEVEMEVGRYGGLIMDYFLVRNAVNKAQRILNPDNDQYDSDSEEVLEVYKITNKEIRARIIAAQNHTPRCIQLWNRKMDLDI